MSATVAHPGTIVFASARSPAAGLYAESAAGSPLRDLRMWAPNGLVWSPDGRRFLVDVPGSD